MLELAQLGNQVNTDTLEEDVQVNPNALLSTTALINAGAAVNKQSSERAARRTMKVVEPIGAVLQPFQAPQQLLFGIVGAIGSAATGKGDPLQVLGRGAGAALDFATFGATAYLPKGDSRKTAVRGYDLAKGAGLPDYLAKPLGLAADFFVDPLLIGSLPAKFIGGTARVAGETATISTMFEARVGENMRQAFFVNGQLDAAAFGQFAKNIAAAPFTTAPIRTALKGVPVGMRQKAAEDFGTFLENTRQVPLTSRNELLGVNASELIISKFGNVPGIPAFNTKAFVETGQSKGVGMPEQFLNDWRTIDTIKANLAVRANEIQITRNKMAPYVSPAQSTEMDKKIGSYLDGTFTPADKLKQRVELEHYAESIGVKPEDLNKLITQTVELDTYAALMRGAASVMNIKEVTKYAIGRDLVGAYREGGQAAVEELAAKYSRFDSPMATALNTLTPGLQRAEKHSIDALEAGDKAFKVTDFRTLADADMVKKINALVVQIGDAPTGMVPTPKPNVAVADLLGPDEIHRGFDEILNGNFLDDAFKADINNMIATKGKGKKAALLELESEGFEVYAKNPDGTPGAKIDPAKLRSSKKKFNVDSFLILPRRSKVDTIATSPSHNFSNALSITGKVNMESAASSSFSVPNTSTLTFNQRFLIRQASGELGEIASKTAIDNQALIAPSILDAIRVRSGLSRYDQAPNDLLANKKMIEEGISSGSHEAMYLNSVMKDLSYGYREGGLLPQTKAAVDDLSRGLEGKLHFRRQFLATTDPESAISQLDMNMTYKIEVDKSKLAGAFQGIDAPAVRGHTFDEFAADPLTATGGRLVRYSDNAYPLEGRPQGLYMSFDTPTIKSAHTEIGDPISIQLRDKLPDGTPLNIVRIADDVANGTVATPTGNMSISIGTGLAILYHGKPEVEAILRAKPNELAGIAQKYGVSDAGMDGYILGAKRKEIVERIGAKAARDKSVDAAYASDGSMAGQRALYEPGAISHSEIAVFNDAAWQRVTAVDNPKAVQMADEFQAAVYNKVGVEPTDALAAYFTDKGFDENQILSFLGSMGDDIPGIAAKRGKDYYPLVRPFLDQMKASPNGVGNVALGSANPFARDTELPQEWIEMMAQIHDIAKVVHDNAKITGSMVVKRGQVSLIHKELSDAGAIIDALPYGSNLGWRRIDEGMAAALKGTGDTSEGVWSNMPFKEGQYIPAAFHRLLVDTVKIDSPGVMKAAYQYLVGAWKQHMVGNPGGITRDVMGSMLMGMNRGVGAKEWMGGMGEMAELMSLARKGDGIFDPKAVSKSGVYASELVEHGDLINHNMIAVEIKEPLRQFAETLYGGKEGAKFLGATKQGDPAQRIAAAMVNFNAGYREKLRAAGKLRGRQVAGKIGMAAVDAGLGLGGPITGAFSDMKGMADSIMRGGLYITMRKRGMKGPEAAKFADETMFNYSEVPMIVDTMRRNGLSPFASFAALSAGRFLRTIYENPYAIARFYRIPDGIKAQNREENVKLDAASPDRLKKALWVPLGKKDGVYQVGNLSAFLTETGTFSAFSSDAVSAYAPPALELWSTIMTGEGFGGSKIYEGGGTLTETPHDQAVRGVLKSVYRAGLTPWAVGSPMFERIAKSIAERTVSKESIGDPKIQALLGYFTEGAFVEGSRQLGIIPKSPITPRGKLSGPTLEPLDALAGIFGISYALVDTNPQHMGGSASINVKNEIKNLDNRKRLLLSEIIRANGNQRLIAEAKQRFDEDKGPLKDRLDNRKGALR